METLKLIVVSDLHRSITQEQQAIIDSHSDIDLILSLGDTPIETIKRVDYGVLGNHDPLVGIDRDRNLHLATTRVKGYTIAGLQGSIRYKDGDFNMYTQEEAKQLKIPKADILISHDSCYLYPDDDAHCGLEALSDYIATYNTLVHLHGHHHESRVYQIGKTVCVSVYKCVQVSITGGSVLVEPLF